MVREGNSPRAGVMTRGASTTTTDVDMTPRSTKRLLRRGLAVAATIALVSAATGCSAANESDATGSAVERGGADDEPRRRADQHAATSGSLEFIPSNFDVSMHLVDDEVPESSAWEPSGNFRFLCRFSHLGYDDPIVFPGQPGASHLHMFFGNDEVDASSDYDSLRNSGGSTCQGGPANRSGYWIPAVLTAEGEVVRPEYITVYYKGPGSAPDGSLVDVEPFPPGIRMIAGQDLHAPVEDARFGWYCEVAQAKSQRIPDCGPDELVGVSLVFPTCWNGTDVDAADHRSHMSYAVRDPESGIASCPPSHPVSLPEFTLGVWFEHDGDSSTWSLSSDRADHAGVEFDNGASFHADWFGAWDPDIQQLWVDRCINGLLNCVGGQLGDGSRLDDLDDNAGPRLLQVPER
jgi:hypothetical protein